MLRKIGRYMIAAEIGRGGFGSVYRAHDPTVGRDVAIKVLTVQDDSLLARFRTEAMTAGNLHHKNIVTIYEFGEDAGRPYLVMELLNGVELKQIISQRTPLSVLDRVEIMSEAAEGLLYAHEHNVIHRDIKPANIMRLASGTVKIMDFGIARLLRDSQTRLTQAGSMVGTIQYMAPELFSNSESDVLSDIWSYGVVFYELLTGAQPFSAAEPSAAMYRIMHADPEPLTALVPSCPPRLDALMQRLLAKDRLQRPQSLDDVLLDLRVISSEIAAAQLPELVRSARTMIDAGNLEGARTVVRRILEMDPGNREAHGWRALLREHAKRAAAKPQIDQLVAQADQDLKQRNYSSAISKIQSALKLDPASQTLLDRLAELQGQAQRAQRSRELVEQAREHLKRDELTAAIRIAGEATACDPLNAEAASVLAEAKAALDLRRKQAEFRGNLEKARGLIVMQSYDEAIALLSAMAIESPSNSEVAALLAEARELRQAQALREAVQAGIEKAKELLTHGKHDEAVSSLESLATKTPNDTTVQQMLALARGQAEAVRTAAEIDRLIQEAEKQLQGKDFQKAFKAVAKALRLSPSEPKVVRLHEKIFEEERQERRRKEIAAEIERVMKLLAEGRAEDALRLVERAEAENPGVDALEEAKRRVLETIETQRREQQAAIDRGKQEAEAFLSGGRAEEAVALLQELVRRFPEEASLATLLKDALARRHEQQQQDRFRSVLEQAHRLSETQQWAAATELLQREVRLNPGAAPLRDELDRLIERRMVEDAALEIEAALDRDSVERAVQLAETALRKHPNHERFVALMARARQRQELLQILSLANTCLAAGDLSRAKTAISAGRARFPDDPKIAELAGRIDQASQLQEDFEKAKKALAAHRLDEAETIAQSLVARGGDAIAARMLLDQVAKLRSEHERRRAYEEARAAALRSMDVHEFDRAIEALERLLEQHPGDAQVQHDLRLARTRRDQAERKQFCDHAIQEAESLISQGQFDRAIECLQAARTRYPDYSELEKSLRAAQAAKQLHEDRARLEASIAAMEQLFRKGDAQQVLAQSEAFLAQREDPRVRQLHDWATTSLAEAERIKKAGRRFNPIYLWGSVAAVLILASVLYFMTRGPETGTQPVAATPVALAVEPTELVFRYEQKGAAPPVQTIQLRTEPADAEWRVSGTDNWFSLTPASGTGSQPVQVAVAPEQMAPGGYSGLALFSAAGNASSTVQVRLEVIAPPRPPDPSKGVEPPRDSKIDQGPVQQTKSIPPVTNPPREPDPIPPPRDPEPPKPAAYSAPPPAVDCHAPAYPGRQQGTVTWTGQLAAGETLAIGRRNAVLRGGGVATGTAIPGCNIDVQIQPGGLNIVESPSAANNFGRIVLRNASGVALSSVGISWRVR